MSVIPFHRPRESHIEQFFTAKAEKAGYVVLKFSPAGRRGYPDRVVLGRPRSGRENMYYGRVLFVEFKRPGEKLRALQVARHDDLVQRGYQVAVVDSREKAIALLRMIGCTA